MTEYGAPDASMAWLLCDRHAPETVAYTIVDGDTAFAVTYAQLRQDSNRVAHGLLGLGIGPGDRVASLLRKGPELITLMIGIWRIGAVYAPLFTAFGAPAADYRLRTAGARLVVVDPEQRAKLDGGDAQQPAPWQVMVVGGDGRAGDIRYDALIEAADAADIPPFVQGGDGAIVHIFTSGTTGLPKGVIHPLRYAAGWESYLQFGLGVTAEDVYWCGADPGWAYGLYAAIVAPLAAGTGTILQVGAFNAVATWRTIEQLGVTNYTAAPTVFRALRAATPSDRSSLHLRRLSSAGEPLTPEVNDWAERELGLTVHDHFGQTEVGMIFANHHHSDFARPVRAGSMGQPLPGWSAKVLDESSPRELAQGEVGRIAIDVVESPMMTFQSYQERAKTKTRFTGNGRYYLLGDLGSVGTEGEFRFSSRDDDVILMAGYRIGPFEVESVISQHPQVAECAVIGAPDEARGEVLEAYVVLRGDAAGSAELTGQIQQLVRTQFAAHAYPRAVHVVDQLPKTPSGKIQRFLLREQRRAEKEAEGTS
ncbi:acyl-CoA synthetase [Leifsonia kafniensis]|uniref:Acyl-CoA synthetase n=1 Tax=Leifsonia kafniensis TaxID=475957 RepID=A0ABP7JZW5_9MICO